MSDDKIKLPKKQRVKPSPLHGLKRLIANRDMSITELARRMCVERATIYNWINGACDVSEENIEKLSKLLRSHPAEIRYELDVFNREDFTIVASIAEDIFAEMGKEFTGMEKVKVYMALYEEFLRLKRLLPGNNIKEDFKKTAKNIIGVTSL
jgi:transcriptional regulator with XRE-family HTH domain